MDLTDHEMVTRLIGRRPMGTFTVAVRREDSSPVVIENAPFLDDGRPMPTRYWLADRALNRAIGRLESTGAIDAIEASLGLDAIAVVHRRYERERDALVPSEHSGPRPSGGVGGTRIGVKCLHAHYANFLATGDDVVGSWVHEQLENSGTQFDPAVPGVASEEKE